MGVLPFNLSWQGGEAYSRVKIDAQLMAWAGSSQQTAARGGHSENEQRGSELDRELHLGDCG